MAEPLRDTRDAMTAPYVATPYGTQYVKMMGVIGQWPWSSALPWLMPVNTVPTTRAVAVAVRTIGG